MKRAPKGHKAKGAGSVVKSKGEIMVQGVLVQEWQRTPIKLLEEYCQKEKRGKPQYFPANKYVNSIEPDIMYIMIVHITRLTASLGVLG